MRRPRFTATGGAIDAGNPHTGGLSFTGRSSLLSFAFTGECMKSTGSIALTWRERDAKGYIDVLPINAFSRIGSGSVITHVVRGPP